MSVSELKLLTVRDNNRSSKMSVLGFSKKMSVAWPNSKDFKSKLMKLKNKKCVSCSNLLFVNLWKDSVSKENLQNVRNNLDWLKKKRRLRLRNQEDSKSRCVSNKSKKGWLMKSQLKIKKSSKRLEFRRCNLSNIDHSS